MFQYNVNAYAENEELTYRTNNPRRAIEDFLENAREGMHTDILNGCTGEVLAIANHPSGEKHCTDEMALMILGYMCAEAWGEEDEDDEPAEETGGEMVLRLIAGMGGLPS